MLRQRVPVRPLGPADHDAALRVCARNRAAGVFVAARIGEGALRRHPGSLLGHYRDGCLDGLAWASANVVPVGLDDEGVAALAVRIGRMRRLCASIFGPLDEVAALWERLAPTWGPVRAIRSHQPLMTTSTPPSRLGVRADDQVRPARLDEVGIVLPAAAHMFTEEIGYAPYFGSDRGYRAGIAALIRQGHTFVRVEQGEVVFKADVGSLALGCAQIQGVWVHPDRRGQGLAVPAMAAVVEQVLGGPADEVSLYVNDFNQPARATYVRCGFEQVGEFRTILL
ncbi:GNAT family N-acetyltransferase [Intrasporangium sp.]|uniref:GNAT family N-acetyltransferase n=1 Tax=Intrasporangium sp. TaxID=1925024 RepID=UPI003221DCF0